MYSPKYLEHRFLFGYKYLSKMMIYIFTFFIE